MFCEAAQIRQGIPKEMISTMNSVSRRPYLSTIAPLTMVDRIWLSRLRLAMRPIPWSVTPSASIYTDMNG